MTLKKLENYPLEREPIEADEIYDDSATIQSNFDELDSRVKALEAVTLGGVTTVTEVTHTIGDSQMVTAFDTTAGAITATLPSCDNVLGKSFILVRLAGANNVTINTMANQSLLNGHTHIVLDTANDSVMLTAISSTRWLLLVNNDATTN